MAVAAVILAAGEGSRMKSDMPKVLHAVGGMPLLHHAMGRAAQVAERTVVVVGHGGAAVAQAARDFDPDAIVVTQQHQRGTAHAVAQARAALADFAGDVVVLFGDTPFVTADTLARVAAARARADVVVLGFETAEPGGYGRLIVRDGALEAIVEAKDATPQELAVTFCNSGILCADRAGLFALIDRIEDNNTQGEFYLTDAVRLARAAGQSAAAVPCAASETLGVNSRADLAAAEATFQAAARAEALAAGVTLTAPDTVFFAADTHIGRDVVIEPHVVFGPGVTVETGARLRAFSHLESCHVGQGAVVGPYARLRPGAEIGNNARIGNFVEIKAAEIGEGAKVNHLSYVGDATVGAAANLGAGTVTCNYDGVSKHRTVVGEGAFIGSDTMLVAPVTVGAQAMTASGSVITSDVPDGALALGRARQETKPGLATRLMAKLRAAKAAKTIGET
ncbi:MAG: bifunctional UDP-N-acetylglucosamine diphosphorylase/glucosamine-1-phosphate N-acetyltransferase GlmU [Pseudomonadota bacterium]